MSSRVSGGLTESFSKSTLSRLRFKQVYLLSHLIKFLVEGGEQLDRVAIKGNHPERESYSEIQNRGQRNRILKSKEGQLHYGKEWG